LWTLAIVFFPVIIKIARLDSSRQARIDLFHVLFVGLSVIDLATARRNGKARAKAVLNLAFQMLSEADQ
jgi:uncharacterized membrane protein